MKVYAIATKVHKCFGHGDYGVDLDILGGGGYDGKVSFPPVFLSRQDAQIWIDRQENNDSIQIVELDVVEPPRKFVKTY